MSGEAAATKRAARVMSVYVYIGDFLVEGLLLGDVYSIGNIIRNQSGK